VTEINAFTPEEEDMAMVYSSFINEKRAFENGFKTSAMNQQVDSALWKIETYLNTTYGFSNDSCYFLDEVEDTVSFTITGYSTTGIPIIDGDELEDFLDDVEAEIADENADNDNEYFWCCIFEVDTVRQTKVKTKLRKVRTKSYGGVYPPGWNPKKFIHYSCMDAYYQGYCDNKHWWGAPDEYQSRYQMYHIAINSDYIMVLHSVYGYQNGDPHFNGIDYLFESPYFPFTLATDEDEEEDELNYYLQSTKEGIDVVNPLGVNNFYLGYVDVHFFQSEVDNMYQHIIWCHYFNKVYIGGQTN
jgi:hypothetical protein